MGLDIYIRDRKELNSEAVETLEHVRDRLGELIVDITAGERPDVCISELRVCQSRIGSAADQLEPDYRARYSLTHNLSPMASAVSPLFYTALWHPETLPLQYPSIYDKPRSFANPEEIITIIESGLITLKSDPDEYKKYEPSSGFGTYQELVHVVEEYLATLRIVKDAGCYIETST
jgi:hypothetical protein